MAINDNTSYELTGAQVKDIVNNIKAKANDSVFLGATSAVPGSKGIVPAPQANDNTKFLCGDGTWKTAGGGQGGAIFYTLYKDTSYNHNSLWEDTPGNNIKLLDSYGGQISAQQLYDAYSIDGSVNINGCIDPNTPTTPEAATSVIHATKTNGYYYFWMVVMTNNGGDEVIRCLKAQTNAMYFSLDHDIHFQGGGGGGVSSVLLYATDRSQYLQGHNQFQGRTYPNNLVLFPNQPVSNTINLLIRVDDLKAIDITGSRIYVSCDFQQEQRFSPQYSGYVYGEIIGYAHGTRNGTEEGFLFMYPGETGRCFSRAITGTVESGTGAVLWQLNSAY